MTSDEVRALLDRTRIRTTSPAKISELLMLIDDLSAALREARKDVERVDWIESALASIDPTVESAGVAWDLEWPATGMDGLTVAGAYGLRAAIDAAREGEE